MQMLETNNINL